MNHDKQQRMTFQRKVILQELVKTRCHPTADEVYSVVRQTIPHISLGTVYRNLEVLSKSGLIKKIEFTGSQKRFDGNPEMHYHITCISCHRIDDIPSDAIKKFKISEKKIKNYHLVGHGLFFTGICTKCVKKEELQKTSLLDGEV